MTQNIPVYMHTEAHNVVQPFHRETNNKKLFFLLLLVQKERPRQQDMRVSIFRVFEILIISKMFVYETTQQ